MWKPCTDGQRVTFAVRGLQGRKPWTPALASNSKPILEIELNSTLTASLYCFVKNGPLGKARGIRFFQEHALEIVISLLLVRQPNS